MDTEGGTMVTAAIMVAMAAITVLSEVTATTPAIMFPIHTTVITMAVTPMVSSIIKGTCPMELAVMA